MFIVIHIWLSIRLSAVTPGYRRHYLEPRLFWALDPNRFARYIPTFMDTGHTWTPHYSGHFSRGHLLLENVDTDLMWTFFPNLRWPDKWGYCKVEPHFYGHRPYMDTLLLWTLFPGSFTFRKCGHRPNVDFSSKPQVARLVKLYHM